jgi:hypothetical protein
MPWREGIDITRNKTCLYWRRLDRAATVTGMLVLFFFSMALPAHTGPRPLIDFRNNFSQTVGLLGRVISPSQGRYLNTGQHKHRINAHTLNIHALSGIGPRDSTVRESENSSCLRPRGYCDRHVGITDCKR